MFDNFTVEVIGMIEFGMPTLIELDSTRQAAKLCKELGLKFIELNMSFPQYQTDTMDVDELAALREEYGIYYTIHIDESLDPCNVNSGISRVYTQSMLQTIEIAKKLGIPTLNMHLLRGIYVTLPHKRTYVYAENEDYYLGKIRQFRDAVTKAVADSKIKVSIENTDGYDLPFLQHALELLLESPVFYQTFDIGHDHAINNIDKPIILKNEHKLCHMHMHDAVGKNVHLALGDGEMDLDYYLALAEKNKCRIVLETKTVEALKKSVEYLNKKADM